MTRKINASATLVLIAAIALITALFVAHAPRAGRALADHGGQTAELRGGMWLHYDPLY
jgi:hypothetical protein